MNWSDVEEFRAREDGVLLTGVTGFLGMELLARYLEHTDRPVYALIRAPSEAAAERRLRRTLHCLFGADHPFGERVTAVRGDITRDGLGLGRDVWPLAERVSEIVHGAASVSFELPLDESRAINVGGTRRLLELAELCQASAGGLRRFTYVSTAYVAGEHSGTFSEDDLDVGQGFRNAYECSKFEAEAIVKRWRSRLPITVVRPSIVVGERDSGWTPAFNVLYWPLRAFSRGAYRVIPARPSAPVDVVSVDYVTDAIFALTHSPQALGATLHLTAGRHTSSVGELVELASEFFGHPPPRLVEPALYRRLVHPLLVRASRDERLRRALRRSEVYFPYFTARVSYDDRRARALLHQTGIEPTPLRTYFDTLLGFALAADWGRRDLPRAGAALGAAPGALRLPPRARGAHRLSPTQQEQLLFAG
jgi:long-chain acyl-CoA synthetase